MKNVYVRIFLFIILISLVGCAAPNFTIVKLNDKFSDPDKPLGIMGDNNLLSHKSSQGGTHIDYKGVYINPFIYVSKNENKIVKLGFVVKHYNFEIADGFRPIRQIIFLTDKSERIELNFKGQDYDFNIGGWNTITKEYNTTFKEGGECFIELVDFIKLSNSTSFEVKIIGDKKTQIYEKSDVLESFIKNINQFYNTEVKKYQ